MTGSAALDILIGLFTLYFVMSTLSSALVELVGNIFALRAKMLKSFLEFQFYKFADQNLGRVGQGFSNLLLEFGKNSSTLDSAALDLTQFYKIQGTKSPDPKEIVPLGKNLLPSIKSDNFAQSLNVLIGLTQNPHIVIMARKKTVIDDFTKAIQKSLDANKANPDFEDVAIQLGITTAHLTDAISQLREEKSVDGSGTTTLFADAKANLGTDIDKLKTSVEKTTQNPNNPDILKAFNDMTTYLGAIDNISDGLNPVDATLKDLKVLVSTLPPSPIKNVLVNAIQQSTSKAAQTEQTINDVSIQVAKWFDGEMERLSEIYKRRSQFFLFLTGLIVAILLNVNTIDIANALAKNPALREAIVEQAKAITTKSTSIDTNDPTWTTALAQLNKLALPIGGDTCPVPPPPPSQSAQPFATAEVTPTLEAAATAEATSTQTTTIQAGSGNVTAGTGPISPSTPLSCNDPWVRWIGILITAAAVALGAPFWFDLLKSVTARADSSKVDEAAKT